MRRGSGIGRLGIIHALHHFAEGLVFRLRRGDIDRRANFHEGKKLWRGLSVQTQTAMRARIRMNEALMKTVSGRKFTPETHRITDIAAWNGFACISRNNAIALHAETI